LIVPSPLVDEPEKIEPKRIKPITFILAGLGVGAVVAIAFSYRFWQYASTHQSTDNATVVGHIHQVSSKIAGTVTYVLVNDNQQVTAGQLLAKLDPKDYENKVQQAQAALESTKRTANAAQANINLSSETTSGVLEGDRLNNHLLKFVTGDRIGWRIMNSISGRPTLRADFMERL
jgi:membrane fusion protein (multidrug efflux system)